MTDQEMKDVAEQDIMTVAHDVKVYNWFCGGWKSKVYLDLVTQQVNFNDQYGNVSGWHGWCDYTWDPVHEGTWTIFFHHKGVENMGIKHVLHQDSDEMELYHTWWHEAKSASGKRANVVMWKPAKKTNFYS